MIVEKQFEYNGYLCVIAMTTMAFRNGYVRIPEGHKCLRKGFDMYSIRCHGGVTFIGKREMFEDDKSKWIGFDTGHCFDGKDYDKAFELYADNKEVLEYMTKMKEIENGLYDKYPIRTLAYCMKECKKIVDQLAEMDNGENNK